MTLENLYLLVSEAISRAEALEDLGLPSARSAYHDLSELEEQVAGLLPATDVEGAIARRGAVRAAIQADELSRAADLVTRFLADPAAPSALRGELESLVQAADALVADRYPRASARFGLQAIRAHAQALFGPAQLFPVG